MALQLQYPDATVKSEIEGAGGVSKLTPFHSLQKVYNQAISARAETFKLMWWCSSLAEQDKSIRQRRNILPGLTTFAAWFN